MDIIVCLKQVFDVSQIKADAGTGRPVFDWVVRKISDYDKNALEEAVRIRERLGGSVRAVIRGDKEAARETLAMGADEAYVFNSDADHLGTAKILSGIIKGLQYNLILLAEASVDEYSFQTGPRLSEALGLPLISYAVKIEVRDNAVIAERELEGRSERLRTRLPAVVTVTKAVNEPRIPTLLQILGAGKKKTVEVTPSEYRAGVETVSVTAIEMKRKGVFVKDVPELTKMIRAGMR